ncbi:MAG TPA: ABC transporter permease [Chitinophagaceae bacterium]
MHSLKLEWLKVKNYRTFWILLGLYVIGLFSLNYIFYQFQLDLKKQLPLDLFPYGFPKVWQTIAWVSSWLLYFPGMLMILIITNEYTYKTHRQNIVDGMTRQQFIYGKIQVAVILAVITTLICIANAIIFGTMHGSKVTVEGTEYILYAFIQALSYIFFGMILAVLLRRGGLAMGIFFIYGLVFESLLGALMHNYVVKGSWNFFPLQTTDVLIPVPFGKEMFYKNTPEPYVLIICALVYITAYCFFSVRKFKTADL